MTNRNKSHTKTSARRERSAQVISEFSVRVFSNGQVDWDGADQLVTWLLSHKVKEGFAIYEGTLSKFGVSRTRNE
jgi:hypothetical protein